MISLFQDIVKHNSDKTALKFGNISFTYSELDRISNCIAQLILQSGHTPEKSPYIGIYSTRSQYTIPMMIGIWKAGFAYVPMDPKYSSERISYIIDDCKLNLVIKDCDAPISEYPQVQWLTIDETILTSHPSPLTPPPSQGRYAYVIYTSGTTGKPKGIPITHIGLRNLIEARKKALYSNVENTLETCIASIAFDYSVWEIFCPLMSGTAVYFFSEEEKANPQRIAEILEEQHVTTFSITPTYLSLIPYRQLPDLKYLVFGGEPCPEPLVRKWQNTSTIVNSYGPTEATVFITANILGKEDSVNDIGLPLEGTTCYILDEHNHQVPQGEKGELFIGGIQVTDGYLNKEELNKQKFIANPFAEEGASDPILYASGDIAYQLPNGHFICCGRKDSQVKLHGFRIELDEIKTAIEQCSQVEAAAVEVATQGEQKYLRAFVKAHVRPLDMGQLKNELKGVLPPYMIPNRIVEVSNIPKNINGKIDFKALAAMLPSEQKADEVSGEIEEQIAAIWHELLGNTGGIKSDSNFIEVGGDSISIIFMMQRINQQFNTQLTIDDIYHNLTLNQLASVVNENENQNDNLSTVNCQLSTVNCQLSPVNCQLPQHLSNVYIHCQLSQQASLSYNLVELMPFGKTLKKDLLLDSWNRLLETHDALRMTFHTDTTGKPFMKVNDCETLTDIPEFSVADENEVKTMITERLSRPYNLEQGPLYFVELYHYPNGKWLFAVYMHHLISDGWSLDEVSLQLYVLYAQKDLDAAGSFANYVYDTYNKEQGPLGADSKKYWDAYQEDVPELKLPGIIDDNNSSDYTTGCVLKQVDDALSEAIHKYCSQHQITLFSFLSSALMLVLYRVSRQQKFMLGYPSSGRTTSESLNMLGYFVHPYPMKFEEALLDMTFDQLCKHTIEDIREATAHPYSLVKLPPVNFTLEEMRHETRMGINLPYQLAPLTLTIDTDEKELQCRWLYRSALADTEQIDLLSRCYLALIQHIVEAEDKPIRKLSMLDKSAYNNMVEQNTVSPLSLPTETIVDVFHQQVELYPDHLALKDESHSYTYEQLDKASDNVASVLLSDGLPQGAVGIYCERSSQSLAIILGIIKAGCFYVPINDSYPKERLRDIIIDSGMQRLVTTRNLLKDVEGLVPSVRICFMEDMLETQTNSSLLTFHSSLTDAPAYMIYTSGTTGKPKGVIVPHSSVVSMVTIGAQNVYCPTPDDRVIQFSTYLFDASVIDIFCTLLSGATLVTAPEAMKKDAEQLFQFMEDEKITWACIPPSFLHSCHHDATTYLKKILVGGESPSQELISRYSNITFINGYGPTESTVCSTSHTYSQDTTHESNCIGKPLPGITCYILDDDHNLLPDGVTGELYLGGLQLATGYHNRPDLNSKSFIDNPFVSSTDLQHNVNTRLYATGDMVCRKSDGLLYFMGRKDFQVKLRGYRIELADIESILQTHPEVRQCLVEIRNIGDAKQLVAHIETANSQLDGVSLRSWLVDKLPAYMTPTYWTFSESFPLTLNGKIDRQRLPQPQLCVAENADDTELSEVDRRCRFAISTILGIPPESIDVNANLMEEIGMNSLQILEYVNQMQARGYQLHASDVYRCKTIRKLADFMESNNEPLTQEQIDSRVVYFSTPDNPYKPLLIVCSGSPYFESFYINFYHKFKNDYTILVVESVCEFYSLRPDFPINMDALMADYARILRPILKERTSPILIAGHSLGGDMALRLAVELDAQDIVKSSVVNIDGTANRSEYTGEGEDIIYTLARTFEQRHYSGPVHLIMCTEFEDIPGQTREEGVSMFPINKENWKKVQPDMPITFVSSVHMQMVRTPENLKIVKEVIDNYGYPNK